MIAKEKYSGGTSRRVGRREDRQMRYLSPYIFCSLSTVSLLTGEMVEAIEREKDNEGRFISSWEDVIKARFDLKSIPNWFTIDLKTGSLCVHMTYPTCFSATVEAGSAGIPCDDVHEMHPV